MTQLFVEKRKNKRKYCNIWQWSWRARFFRSFSPRSWKDFYQTAFLFSKFSN